MIPTFFFKKNCFCNIYRLRNCHASPVEVLEAGSWVLTFNAPLLNESLAGWKPAKMVKKQAPKPSKPRTSSKPSGKRSNPSSTPKGSVESTQQPGAQPPRQDPAHQQKLLNIFQSTFDSVLSSESFTTTLQEVKTALFNREFDKAFGNEEYLEAYAARWSPTRALCYASALTGIRTHLEDLCSVYIRDGKADAITTGEEKEEEEEEQKATAVIPLKVLAIGGAAAEAVAFGSYLNQQQQASIGEITLLDIAPWAGVVEKLRVGLTTPPVLSKYASAAAQAANAALVDPGRLRDVTFCQHDVLGLDSDELTSLVIGSSSSSSSSHSSGPTHPPPAILVTLLFTLNELFTAGGIGKTTKFLLTLTSVLRTGSLLLVIDSPGSYSETTVGKESKRYPMQWLLDKILLGTEEDDNTWEKVESSDSVWFRLGQELRYPIQLEDMRYQIHLYRRGGI